MTDSDWADSNARSLMVYLNGDALDERDPRGEQITDDSFLLLFNPDFDALAFTLPGSGYAAGWEVVIDTAAGATPPSGSPLMPGSTVEVANRALIVLRSLQAP